MNLHKNLLVLLAVAALLLGSMSVYTIDQRQRGIVLRLNEVVQADVPPGLHLKLPLVSAVRKVDVRIMTLEGEPKRFLTKEKKNLMVDFFVKWRVTDPLKFYRATNGGDLARATQQLSQVVAQGLRAEFGKRTLQEVVAGDRADITRPVVEQADKDMEARGIEVVDARIRRIDLSQNVLTSVYKRMRTERARVAAQFRARGAEAAEKIRADADRQKQVILADAYRTAQTLRGEGDAKAAAIYAKAYDKDPEFYAFYRSLGAYRDSFASKKDVIVLQPDSQFFKYYKDAKGGR